MLGLLLFLVSSRDEASSGDCGAQFAETLIFMCVMISVFVRYGFAQCECCEENASERFSQGSHALKQRLWTRISDTPLVASLTFSDAMWVVANIKLSSDASTKHCLSLFVASRTRQLMYGLTTTPTVTPTVVLYSSGRWLMARLTVALVVTWQCATWE